MAIILERVSKAFGERAVFTDMNLTLNGRVCLLGPSGCGKTTLLRLIAGLEQPDSGSIIQRPERVTFSCHFQEDRLLPWYTARENLSLFTPDPDTWLERILLMEAGDRYPDELSGGMRRRIALARALAHASDVLLLDEPLRELDPSTARAMLKLIDRYAGERLLILVTHDRSQGEALGCRMVEWTDMGIKKAAAE